MDLNSFDLVKIDSVKRIKSPKVEKFYDLTTDGDHTFFIKCGQNKILVHNCDGDNITSMLLGWWKRLAPKLYDNKKIFKLKTPIVILKDAKENPVKWFYNILEFKQWEKENPNSKLKVIYLKGLGSLSIEDLDFIISKEGFDSMLDEFYVDEESDKMFEDWLGDDAEPRKKYLKEYNFDINMI